MSEASFEWAFNFNFRLKEDKNYNERWSELIEVLKSFDFQKNLTPSSWFLHSLFPNDLEEIEEKMITTLVQQFSPAFFIDLFPFANC